MLKEIAALLAVAIVPAFGQAQASSAQPLSPSAGQSTAAQPTAPEPTGAQLQAQLTKQGKTLQDWANLSRYRDADAQVSAAASGEQRVVFMGDSITDGWGLGKFFPGKPYVNRGISGQTTPQMLIRFRPDVVALKPKAVVILAGTNDLAGNTGPETLDDIEGNLMSMAQLAQANGIRVILASVTPVCDYIKPQIFRRSPEKIVALNAWMKDYCSRNGFTYLDYYSAMLDEHNMLRKELTSDGLHPTAAGYEVMGPLASKAIETALGKS